MLMKKRNIRDALVISTNEKGEYSFSELKRGKYTLHAHYSDYMRMYYYIKISGKDRTTVPITLQKFDTNLNTNFSLYSTGFVEPGRVIHYEDGKEVK